MQNNLTQCPLLCLPLTCSHMRYMQSCTQIHLINLNSKSFLHLYVSDTITINYSQVDTQTLIFVLGNKHTVFPPFA